MSRACCFCTKIFRDNLSQVHCPWFFGINVCLTCQMSFVSTIRFQRHTKSHNGCQRSRDQTKLKYIYHCRERYLKNVGDRLTQQQLIKIQVLSITQMSGDILGTPESDLCGRRFRHSGGRVQCCFTNRTTTPTGLLWSHRSCPATAYSDS